VVGSVLALQRRVRGARLLPKEYVKAAEAEAVAVAMENRPSHVWTISAAAAENATITTVIDNEICWYASSVCIMVRSAEEGTDRRSWDLFSYVDFERLFPVSARNMLRVLLQRLFTLTMYAYAPSASRFRQPPSLRTTHTDPELLPIDIFQRATPVTFLPPPPVSKNRNRNRNQYRPASVPLPFSSGSF
jgi:hypothetical protein